MIGLTQVYVTAVPTTPLKQERKVIKKPDLSYHFSFLILLWVFGP